MPSINYMNQSAPFWDFIASLEQQGQAHPMFSQNHDQNGGGSGPPGPPPPGPPPAFSPWGWGGWGGRGFPHRGPPGPPPHDEATGEKDVDMDGEKEKDINEKGGEQEKGNGEGPPSDHEGWGGHRRGGGGRRGRHGERGEGASGSDNEGWGGHRRCGGGRHGRHGEKSRAEGEGSGSDTEGWGRHGRCGGGRRGRHGPPGPHDPHGPHARGHHGPPGPHGPPHGPGHHGRGGFGGRRGWGGPWGRGGPFGGGAPFNPFSFAAGLFDPPSTEKNDSEDFTPEADIFDTTDAFVIHVSLPGAKKEDVGVNWDAEKSELSIAGVVYRPGDEDFLKTLAMNERKVGPFERKVRLGTRASPAQVDAEGISAKLEDGVLRIEVPKLDAGFVEVRKVDIE